jgi:hypothetical protein
MIDALTLDFDKLDRTPPSDDPFRHVVVENFVPAASLAKVIEGLPPMSSGGSFPPSALRLGDGARALVGALEGDRFRQCVARKFDLDLASAPTMLTIRGRTRERDGQIHCDSTAKRVTILLYLNPETEAWTRREGCLRLLRNGTDLDNYAVEVPPVNGTLLIFPNGPTTWHGHKTYVGRRYAIQLNYMADGAKARAEIRRHKVSAVLKRFSSAA